MATALDGGIGLTIPLEDNVEFWFTQVCPPFVVISMISPEPVAKPRFTSKKQIELK